MTNDEVKAKMFAQDIEEHELRVSKMLDSIHYIDMDVADYSTIISLYNGLEGFLANIIKHQYPQQ